MDDLSVRNDLNEEIPIHSNMEEFCIECGIEIADDNDSGWERFRPDGITTQKICKDCSGDEVYPQLKSEEV